MVFSERPSHWATVAECVTHNGHRVAVDELLHVLQIHGHVPIGSGLPDLGKGVEDGLSGSATRPSTGDELTYEESNL